MTDTSVRDRIMAEAARLFVARGYNGISMREIAEAVGVSKAGLYYHFTDKEALFVAVISADVERLAASVTAARAAGETARDQVRALLRALFALPPDERAMMRLASQGLPELSPAAAERFLGLYHGGFIGQVSAILRGGIERGELRPLDVPAATWVLLGMAFPFFGEGTLRDAAASERAVELIVGVFFDGAVSAD